LQPGVRGLLPKRHFPVAEHGITLSIGMSLDVAVTTVRPDGKLVLRWLPPIAINGSVSAPIVEVNRHSTNSPIDVLLTPWIRGQLLPGTAKFRKLRTSAGIGQRIRVKIRKVIRDEGNRQIRIELDRMSKHGTRTDTIFATPKLVLQRQKEVAKEAAKKTRARQKSRAAAAKGKSSIKVLGLLSSLATSGVTHPAQLEKLRSMGFEVNAIEAWIPSKADSKRLTKISRSITRITSPTALMFKREAAADYNAAFDLTATHYRQLQRITDRFLLDHSRDPRTGNHVPSPTLPVQAAPPVEKGCATMLVTVILGCTFIILCLV
jgi:hypothetical protein